MSTQEENGNSLQHYGVKGMKWGVRKAAEEGVARVSNATGLQITGRQKANGKQISAARAKLGRQSKAYRQEYKKYKQATKSDRPNAERIARLEKNLRARRKQYMNDPNRVIAARMSRGEKFIQAYAATNTGPVGLIISGAAIGASSVASRRIEYTQKNGGYKTETGKIERNLGAQRSASLARIGAGIAPSLAALAGKAGAHAILTRAATNRNAAKLAKPLSIAAKAQKLKYAKAGRGGAYKITTL